MNFNSWNEKNKKMNKKTTQDNLQNPRPESWDHNNLINKINYGVLFLINLILNNEIEKKNQFKKITQK
jgi:hypothetical protein